MDLAALIVHLISGAVGGNLGGALLQKFSLGVLGNSIAGIVGGGLGGRLVEVLTGWGGTAATGVEGVLSNVVGGGVGGIIIMIIVGVIKNMVNKPSK